jgi:hypothetical protein
MEGNVSNLLTATDSRKNSSKKIKKMHFLKYSYSSFPHSKMQLINHVNFDKQSPYPT